MTAAPAQNNDETAATHQLDAALNLQRKAAIVAGGAVDHAGRVRVVPMEDFDMQKTIFGGLEGFIPRTVMQDKLAKEAIWNDDAAQEVESAYGAAKSAEPEPEVNPDLIAFMHEECDFSMEHADGTFLEHLLFCHDYAARHYPDHSPNVALLHSILGTATNTFAMPVKKFDALSERLTEFEALQIEAFPSVLRLFYDQGLLAELTANLHRLDELQELHCYRVMDNKLIVLDAESVWHQLNYHLMHFVDFMPSANWWLRRNDPLLMMFRELSTFLDKAGQRRAHVDVSFPTSPKPTIGEDPTIVSRLTSFLPETVTKKLARKTIRKYSDKIGHNLDYRLVWR
jgi:hypothetical protein